MAVSSDDVRWSDPHSSPQTTELSDTVFDQELQNQACNLVVLFIQREMTGVEQMDLGIRKIALESLSPGSNERGIVPSPDYQSRRPVLAQPRLPRWIRGDVRLVVVKQSGLNLVLPGFRQMGVLVSPRIGVVTIRMRGAERMTLFGRRQRYKGIEHLRMRFRIGPIARDTSPLCAEAFLVGIGVLMMRACTRSGCAKMIRKPTGPP